MKQLPEEKELRAWRWYIDAGDRKTYGADISALIKAVREDCAKVADAHAKHFASFAEDARKKGHNVDDIVARRIASEDIATEIRRTE